MERLGGLTLAEALEWCTDLRASRPGVSLIGAHYQS
jgi:hypothetical protein